MNSNLLSPKTKHISVNGISLAYCDWPGEGDPLICLPNITGHKGSFTSLAKKLSPKYRVLALDMRGRGESSKPKDGYGFAYHAKDLFAFADALGIDQFSLIGHSFGATACVYSASIRPTRLRTVILMDGGADPNAESLQMMYETIGQLGKVYSSMDNYMSAQRAISYYRPWTAALERYLQEDVEVLADGSVRSRSSAVALERDLDIHFLYSMCLHFPNLHCPVMFLRPQQGLLGNTGHVYSDVEASNIVRNIPNCRRADVHGGNHYTMLIQDNPPVFPFIDEFLSQALRQPIVERSI
jgi:pimeloyl-ACP methyl ester carboxylesterase